jgi:hypothetical protein
MGNCIDKFYQVKGLDKRPLCTMPPDQHLFSLWKTVHCGALIESPSEKLFQK